MIDYGNERVQQRREAFKVFQGGKASDQIGDPIGRAWAVGLLDGQGVDAAILRDVGRRYAGLHALYFSETATKVARFERGSGGPGGVVQTQTRVKAGLDALDDLSRASGLKNWQAMRKLCVECSPDENPPWLYRLIDRSAWLALCAVYEMQSGPEVDAFRKVKAPPEPSTRDRMILSQAVKALVAMVQGVGPRGTKPPMVRSLHS